MSGGRRQYFGFEHSFIKRRTKFIHPRPRPCSNEIPPVLLDFQVSVYITLELNIVENRYIRFFPVSEHPSPSELGRGLITRTKPHHTEPKPSRTASTPPQLLHVDYFFFFPSTRGCRCPLPYARSFFISGGSDSGHATRVRRPAGPPDWDQHHAGVRSPRG